MSTTGASIEPTDPSHLLVTTTGPKQTAGASDVFMTAVFTCGVAHRIYCGTTGNIGIKRRNDSGFTSYPVLQGTYLDGAIIAVGGTGNGTDANFVWIPEV